MRRAPHSKMVFADQPLRPDAGRAHLRVPGKIDMLLHSWTPQAKNPSRRNIELHFPCWISRKCLRKVQKMRLSGAGSTGARVVCLGDLNEDNVLEVQSEKCS